MNSNSLEPLIKKAPKQINPAEKMNATAKTKTTKRSSKIYGIFEDRCFIRSSN